MEAVTMTTARGQHWAQLRSVGQPPGGKTLQLLHLQTESPGNHHGTKSYYVTYSEIQLLTNLYVY